MSDLDKFHLDATPSAAMLELIEISHPLWPKPLRYVTNHADGVTVKHEDGLVYNYEFMPVQINKGANSDDLDQTLSITVGDLGQVVPQLLKIIRDANNFERPSVVYRAYSSSNLESPLQVVKGYEVEDRATDHQATTFNAATKRANSTGTGMFYTVDNFPSLKAFF
jgi:hypothetical protein